MSQVNCIALILRRAFSDKYFIFRDTQDETRVARTLERYLMLKYVGGLAVLSYSTKTIRKESLVLRSLAFPLGLVFGISRKINPVNPLRNFRGRNKANISIEITGLVALDHYLISKKPKRLHIHNIFRAKIFRIILTGKTLLYSGLS